ncbi:hypothetical protein COF35_03865 [Bacillus wiedmannii]|nr:hypothetical protein COF35_03865 [Bacillus wiedmannii]
MVVLVFSIKSNNQIVFEKYKKTELEYFYQAMDHVVYKVLIYLVSVEGTTLARPYLMQVPT